MPFMSTEIETIKIKKTPAITVRELLQFVGQSRVYTILATATVQEMAQVLREHNIGALVVTDAENHFMGAVSERDGVKILAENKLASTVKVGEIMTPAENIVTASLDDNTLDLIKLYKDNSFRFRHIPTFVNGEADGMVSERDVFRHLVHLVLEQAAKDNR